MTALTPRASKQAVTEVYNDCAEIIRHTAITVARRYGLDFEEAVAEANFIFLEAYHKYRRDKGSFQARLVYLIRMRLVGRLRDVLRDRARLPTQPLMEGFDPSVCEPDTVEPLTIDDLVDPWEQDRDVLTVAALALDTPPAVDADLFRVRRRRTATADRDCLTRYLKQELGWSAERVRAAYRAIRGQE